MPLPEEAKSVEKKVKKKKADQLKDGKKKPDEVDEKIREQVAGENSETVETQIMKPSKRSILI
jgi:hypothetical protein